MQLELSPVILALGALVGVFLAAGIFSARLRRTLGLTVSSLLLRGLLLLSLVITLASPSYQRRAPSSKIPVLADISESVDEELGQTMIDQALALGIPDQLQFIAFAKQPASFGTEAPSSFSRFKTSWLRLDSGESNLSEAVSAAPSGPVLLLSDGFETQGSLTDKLAALSGSGTKLYPLVPSSNWSRAKQFTISQLHAPLIAPAQKSVEIRTSVTNTTSETQRGTLRISHDGRELSRQMVEVRPGEEQVLITPSDPSKDGIKEIKAELRPSSSSLPSSSEIIFLSGESREKVLLLAGSDEDSRLLKETLEGQSYQLSSLIARPRIAPAPDLDSFSTVILANIALTQLPPEFPRRLAEWEQAGGGLVMVGGNKSFGLGGYIGSPLEPILPVELVPPQTEQKRLNIAVMLVIDKSQSMADNQKLEFSKEAAREVVRNLKDDDLLGVIGFDSVPFEVVRLGPVSQVGEMAMRRIGLLFPRNRTNLRPSMDEGRRRLESADAGRKHMIVLTDGKLPDADQTYIEMVKQMRLAGITMSTVLIGREYDFGFLKSLSEYGGGAYYQTDDPSTLPRIFLQDVKVRSGEKTLKEQQEFLVRKGPGRLVSTTLEAFPPLRGYVQTRRREASNTELVLMAQDKADPLLASWTYKRGKVTAFTSDANGRWSSNWAGTRQFARFWSEIVDAVRPEAGRQTDKINFDLRHSVERRDLILDLSVYSETGSVAPEALIILPDQSSRQISFTRTAPGRFEAKVEQVQPGRHEIRTHFGDRSLTPVALYLPGELFGERKGQGMNLPFLELLSSRTGGKINPSVEDLAGQIPARYDKVDLRPHLLFLAAVLLLLEVAARELLAPRLGRRWRREARA